MPTEDGGQAELKGRLRRCTAALAGDTKNPALLSEMADVLTLLGRGAEAVSFRLNAARCFQGEGQLAEAATSCDLALLEDPDHDEALAMRAKLPEEGVPFQALTMDLPALDDPPEDYPEADEETVGRLRNITVEVEESDVLSSNTVAPVEIFEEDGLPPPEAVAVVEVKRDSGELEGEDFDADRPTIPHDAIEDRISTKHAAASGSADLDERPTTRHEPVLTPMGWGMMDGEEEVIELREPSRKRSTGPRLADMTAPIEPQSQPLEVPDSFRAEGEERTYAAGDTLIREQDQATELFLLTEGKVEVLKETWAHQPGRNRLQQLAILEAGSCLGELSLLGDGRRHATVKALEPSKALVFSKGQIKELMRSDADVNRAIRRLYRRRLQDTLLRFSALFKALPPEVARDMMERAKPRRLEPNKVVVKEGSQASGVYFVLLGLLDVSSSEGAGEGEAVLLHRLSDGDFFGGISNILKQLSPGTVRTRSFVQLLHLSPSDFDELSEKHPVILEHMRQEAERRVKSYHSIISGEAQYEVGTFVYLLEKKKETGKQPTMKATGWGEEEE